MLPYAHAWTMKAWIQNCYETYDVYEKVVVNTAKKAFPPIDYDKSESIESLSVLEHSERRG